MSRLLVIVLTGKENLHAEMVAFNFAINSARNAGAEVEMLFLGRGVQALNARQKNSHEFQAQLEAARKMNIALKGCSVSAEAEGLRKEDIFEGIEMVMGGVEVSRRIEEGFVPLTF
jgi:tRNA 2-thiouridine synthesizing protein D